MLKSCDYRDELNDQHHRLTGASVGLSKALHDELEEEKQRLAQVEAENARIKAENARIKAENAWKEAENARIKAENARKEAENARQRARIKKLEDEAK
ncbi:Hypothetical predicted protein, partial [Scomber scombrus]